MNKQADDLSGADAAQHYQDMMRKSWETLAAWLQPPSAAEKSGQSRATSTKSPLENPTLQHALAGLKSYSDWLQSAAASMSTPPGDWRQQMEQLFGGASQPFSHGVAGADMNPASAFVEQWQAWLNQGSRESASAAKSQGRAAGFNFEPGEHSPQQALADAVARHLEALQRYQALMQRANTQAVEKMQAKLSTLTAPGEQIESLKALYDIWVDCAEEVYADIALSEDFRQAYGDMVNTQIRVRQLQQEQTEYLCQQLGIPTRSEVSSLGERLHALRREIRKSAASAPVDHAEELAALRREVAMLKKQLSAGRTAPSSSRNTPATEKAVQGKPARSAVKKSMTKSAVKKAKATAVPKTASKRSVTKPVPQAKPRKSR